MGWRRSRDALAEHYSLISARNASLHLTAGRRVVPLRAKHDPQACVLLRLSCVRLLFDRGTILFREVDPRLDPSAIPGVLWEQQYADGEFENRGGRVPRRMG